MADDGTVTQEFEQAFAGYLGTKYVGLDYRVLSDLNYHSLGHKRDLNQEIANFLTGELINGD